MTRRTHRPGAHPAAVRHPAATAAPLDAVTGPPPDRSAMAASGGAEVQIEGSTAPEVGSAGIATDRTILAADHPLSLRAFERQR